MMRPLEAAIAASPSLLTIPGRGKSRNTAEIASSRPSAQIAPTIPKPGPEA